MAKQIIQILVVGSQVVGRAFARALKHEFVQSQAAASKAGGGKAGAKSASKDQYLGMSIQEAKQILNIDNFQDPEVQKNYDHLFKVNEKSKGGSFYIQSKVVRAKERIDEELKLTSEKSSQSQPPPQS